MVCKFLALLEGHLALTLKITLISDQNFDNIVASVLLNLVHPILYWREWFAVSDVIDYDHSVGALVVAWGDGLETFCTSSVPNLELYGLSIHFIIANLEVDSDGGHEAVIEQIIL